VRAVNLLPREAKRSRKRLTAVAQLAVVSPLVVGSVLVAGYLLASSKVNDNKATLQALQDELATLPAPPPEPQGNPELAVQRDQRIVALSAALQSRLAWDRILRQISAVLPGDVWLTTLSAQSPQRPSATPLPAATSTTGTSATSTSTTTTSSTTTTTPVPAPPPTGPLNLTGYTYSQEGVARFLSRLAVVPALQNVKLLQSAQALVAGRTVVLFTIQANVRMQETG
jgi:Tfp pilus assembly protein PilN